MFMGLTWAEYISLPGHPKYVDPHTGTLSKADVIVHYQHQTRLRAVEQEREADYLERQRLGATTHW